MKFMIGHDGEAININQIISLEIVQKTRPTVIATYQGGFIQLAELDSDDNAKTLVEKICEELEQIKKPTWIKTLGGNILNVAQVNSIKKVEYLDGYRIVANDGLIDEPIAEFENESDAQKYLDDLLEKLNL